MALNRNAVTAAEDNPQTSKKYHLRLQIISGYIFPISAPFDGSDKVTPITTGTYDRVPTLLLTKESRTPKMFKAQHCLNIQTNSSYLLYTVTVQSIVERSPQTAKKLFS